jgi:hypothetical protein
LIMNFCRRSCNLSDSPCIRAHPVHNDHWHTIRPAAFQACRTVAGAVRKNNRLSSPDRRKINESASHST